MATGILMGHSVPMALLSADHTYVTSSLGHIWPCFGRSSGGTRICSGLGDVKTALCLSQPRGHAGIVYGVSGVCHQAANRILYPSGKTVQTARGYRWSIFAFGVYGKDVAKGTHYTPEHHPWPELAACTVQGRR